MSRRELRVEKELAPYADPCVICLDMIETLPEAKQARAAEWFQEIERIGVFDWRKLASFFRKQFEDKQARQAAAALLNRMEQGYHQFFDDFLKDFDYRVALSGGSEAHTSLGKTHRLKDSLNPRLRRALIGVKLPPPEDYSAWVEEVREVAAELEGLADYRPKGASQTNTVLGPPKSGSAQLDSRAPAISNESEPKLDSERDIVMGGTNALLAALRDLKENGIAPHKATKKPRAPWRSKEEFKKLVDEGKCTRCTKKGHIGRFCHSHLPAHRPMGSVSALGVSDEISVSVESENKEP